MENSTTTAIQMSSARRCLFGRPSPEESKQTLRRLKQMSEELTDRSIQKWGFNFREGRPVEGGHEIYEWEKVDTNATPDQRIQSAIEPTSTNSDLRHSNMPRHRQDAETRMSFTFDDTNSHSPNPQQQS